MCVLSEIYEITLCNYGQWYTLYLQDSNFMSIPLMYSEILSWEILAKTLFSHLYGLTNLCWNKVLMNNSFFYGNFKYLNIKQSI